MIQQKLYLLGFMGSGKSHVGRRLSRLWNMPFIDLDDFIEEREQMLITDIFATKGEDEFRKIERAALLETQKIDRAIIGCGGGTPCFLDNMAWMNAHGTTVYLNYPVQILFDRLKSRKLKRPLIKNMDNETLFAFITNKLGEREKYYLQAKYQYQPNEKGTEAADVLNAQFPPGTRF